MKKDKTGLVGSKLPARPCDLGDTKCQDPFLVEKKEDKDEMVKDFVRYEKLQGKRSTRRFPYELKPFWDYLETEGLTLTDMNYRRAQELQTHLVTLEDEEGKVRYCARSAQSIMQVVSNFYGYLKRKGTVFSNPFLNLDPIHQGEPLPRNLPDEKTMAKLLDGLRCFWKHPGPNRRRRAYRLHVMAEVLYSTGLRLSELASLTTDDIDLEGRLIQVRDGKGGKDRKAFLNEYAAMVLKHYIHEMRAYVLRNPESPYLFGVRGGRNLDRHINEGLKEAGLSCGIEKFTTHAIRHTLGFHLLRRGCDLRYIQLILGHDDMESTSLYTKVEKRDLRRELDRCHPRKFGERS